MGIFVKKKGHARNR